MSLPFRITCILLLVTVSLIAQENTITRTHDPIVIDGKFNEPAWEQANILTNFWQHFPFDSSLAINQTEVRILYDDHFIYVSAKMYTSPDVTYVTPSLRRDFRGAGNDAFTVNFDTFLDRTNAFQFGVNPFGVQREAQISNGGADEGDLLLSWDNKWYSATEIGDGYWTAEFAIPFKTLRFKEGSSDWFVKFYRINSHLGERTVWPQTPRNYQIYSLAYTSDLQWDHPIKKPGANITIIPYGAGGMTKNFVENLPVVRTVQMGTDAKIGIGSALNLDLTANPDFSQVEVDQQITNLNRFENFYPEKRQFFLENSDLFGDFGYSNIRPFFSRRIGVTRDDDTGQNIQNKIYGGARLSGKINNKTRVGFMSMQAAEDGSINLPSINYSVAAIQRKIFSRSNIGFIFINKQAWHDSTSTKVDGLPNTYNRMAGIDFNLASKDNIWNGKIFYHRSFDQNKKDSAYAATIKLSYQVAKLNVEMLLQEVGANYNPEVGFVPRTRFKRFAPEAYYFFYPKSKILNNHGPGTDFDFIGNDVHGITDYDANLWYNFNFQSTASGYIRLRKDYVYLFQSFDPTRTGGTELASGTTYHYYSAVFNFTSNTRKKLYMSLTSKVGQYFNGNRQSLEGTLFYRIQNHAIISTDFSLNRIRLPKPYASANLLLISPKFDITFSKKLFWTTYFQYNKQINNLNINSRLQWRFKPVSDIFLVYTDNYATETYTDSDMISYQKGYPKLRALVVKITYWLNL